MKRLKKQMLPRVILSLCGTGYFPKAPGTLGSLVSILLIYGGFQKWHTPFHFDVFSALYLWMIIFLLFGGKHLLLFAIKKMPYDQKWIVLDEFLGLQISLVPFFFLPINHIFWWIFAFGIFRFFDIIKPLGINKIDQKKTPESVFYDDALAGIYTAILLTFSYFYFDSMPTIHFPTFISQTLYLALPAFFANMAPIFAQKFRILEKLNIPIDNGKKWEGSRIFGKNKTYRGFFVGIFMAMVISFIQFWCWENRMVVIPYFENAKMAIFFGFLAGFGALFGDTIKSFFKRRRNIKSGNPFIPWDQIDYLIGFLTFTAFIVEWEILQIIFLLIFGMIFNPIINALGYFLKIKKTYW